VDADGFEFFYSGFILIFKDKVHGMYMAQNASYIIIRLFTEAACESLVASYTYIL
jgi:hypothetical protein